MDIHFLEKINLYILFKLLIFILKNKNITKTNNFVSANFL
ncbi:hypothetical protein J699_01295 [Acinetobacter sp. 1000160]|nr:hypothetical protein J699_01295 [Acinetobacter sp. 1000160]